MNPNWETKDHERRNTTLIARPTHWGKLFLGLLGAVICQAAARAQHPNVARGYTPGSFDLSDIDTVNGFNGNLTIRLPIGKSYPVGGGMGSYSLSLVYNSNIWDHVSAGGNCQGNNNVTDTYAFASPIFNSGLGWTVSLGRLSTGIVGFVNPPGSTGLTYFAPDGSSHLFYPTLAQPGGGSVADPGYSFTNDSSFLRYNQASRVIEFPDGLRHQFKSNGLPTTIEDRFGNGLTIEYPEMLPGTQIPAVWMIKEHNSITDPSGDSPIRTHEVYFRQVSFPSPPLNANQTLLEQKAVVDRIEIAAFDPKRPKATYTFTYTGEGGDVQIRGEG